MKAYAPSDRGTSAAVVVSQELLTATVTGLQPTKEREKASTIFFYFAKYLCCQQGYNQGEKKLRQCSFFVTLHTLLYVHLAKNQSSGCKGKEKAKRQSIRLNELYLVTTSHAFSNLNI